MKRRQKKRITSQYGLIKTRNSNNYMLTQRKNNKHENLLHATCTLHLIVKDGFPLWL